MIDNERVKRLSEEKLEQIADMWDRFDCYGISCSDCPFELEEPYRSKSEFVTASCCSLAYAKRLSRGFTE